MSKKLKQNEEVFVELISGKSLLQLYVDMKEERDQLAASLAKIRMGIM
jgi:hypothetical protein